MKSKTSPDNNDDSGFLNHDGDGDNHDVTGDLSGELSTLFPGFDQNREKAHHDATYQEIDPEETLRREAVAQEEAAIPAYKNPLLKTGVVFAAVGIVICGGAALFLASGGKTKVATKPVETKAEFENPVVASSQLKGQLALDRQNELLKGEKLSPQPIIPANQTVPTTKPEVKLDVKPELKPSVKPTPTPPVAVVTPPTPVYRPTPPVPRPISRAYPMPVPTPITIYTPPKPPVAQVRQDPKSRTIPTYTPIYKPKPAPLPKANVIATAIRPTAPVILQSWQQQSTQGTFGGRSSKVATSPVTKPTAPESVSPYLASENEIYGLPGEPRKTISTGAKSLGIILTPVQIAAGDETDQVITIGMNQPLVDRDGKVVIPAGSQVQFKVSTLNNGWLKATSTKAFVNDQEIAIEGAFALTTDKGTPLVAESLQFGEDLIAKQDQRSFILGALQNVGKVLTQPDTTSSTTAGVGGISTSNSSKANPSVIGAIFDGGFSPLATQQMTRSTAELNRLLNASKMWYLPVGTSVKVTTVKSLRI
jgi:hypothetical protein